MDMAEKMVAARADGLVGTSAPVLERLRKLGPGKPGLLLENGVEFEHFAKPAEPPAPMLAIKAPRLVYVGALDERFDFAATGLLARTLPTANILLIGPITKDARVLAGEHSNIHLIGAIPYNSLPGWLQQADVALLPLAEHPANIGRSPMNLYEYAAAGLPVVARNTPELARRREPFVCFYNQPAELPEAVQKTLENLQDRLAYRKRAATQAWSLKASELMNFITGLPQFIRT